MQRNDVAIARELKFAEATIAEAARLILDGEAVAIPTETVYGLAADATNGVAVAQIYEAKGRPAFNPLIVHCVNLTAAERLVHFHDESYKLAETFWPGPLTLVLPLRAESGIASLVSAGLPTLAVRVPAHPAMQALLAATGKPLAAPSANASGTISPTRAEHVARSLGDRIALIIDGGACELGLESTIIGFGAAGAPYLLRPGPLDLGLRLHASGKIIAPGQLASHYAPSKPLRLEAENAQEGDWLIGFGSISGHSSLSETGNLNEAASRLFDLLHLADAAPAPRIAVAPIPNIGLGLAINDRLRRAAA